MPLQRQIGRNAVAPYKRRGDIATLRVLTIWYLRLWMCRLVIFNTISLTGKFLFLYINHLPQHDANASAARSDRNSSAEMKPGGCPRDQLWTVGAIATGCNERRRRRSVHSRVSARRTFASLLPTVCAAIHIEAEAWRRPRSRSSLSWKHSCALRNKHAKFWQANMKQKYASARLILIAECAC